MQSCRIPGAARTPGATRFGQGYWFVGRIEPRHFCVDVDAPRPPVSSVCGEVTLECAVAVRVVGVVVVPEAPDDLAPDAAEDA
jgi:hypothetical protein